MLKKETLTLEEFAKNIRLKLEEEDLVELVFDDLSNYLSSTFGSEFINSESLIYIADVFRKTGLDSEPKIRSGKIERRRHSPIFIYKSDRYQSVQTAEYKYAVLMLRMAVIMTIADGITGGAERDKLKSLIWGMEFISLSEKKSLFAKANYLLSAELYLEPKVREYMRLFLSPSLLIEKVGTMSPTSVAAILDIAMEIAISDGYLEERELSFMKNIYRELDLPVRRAKTDLENFANNRYVNLKSQKEIDISPESELYDVEDVLGDLFLDFDEL